jgi:hypothetical protein
LHKDDRLRNNCGNLACINPYHYEKKSAVCPSGHPRGETTNYPTRQTWTNALGEEKEILVVHCRVCKRIDVNKRRAEKRSLAAKK